MKTRIVWSLLSLAALLLLPLSGLARGVETSAIGTAFTYQGHLQHDGAPLDGLCAMDFWLFAAAEGGAPIGHVHHGSVAVTDGWFAVQLDFGALSDDARWIEVAVQCAGDATPLTLGRQRLTPAPVALYAASAPWSRLTDVPPDVADGDDVDDTVSWDEVVAIVGTGTQEVAQGNHTHDSRYYTRSALQTAGQAQVHWGNLTDVPAGFDDGVDDVGGWYAQRVVVALSGGDFSSVQAAIDSITDAAADKPYLVWVAPGVYTETVTLKPHVHLQGAGQDATRITSAQGTSSPPTQATVVLVDHTSLRDVAVVNTGVAVYNVALLATDGVTATTLSNVSVGTNGSRGGSGYNYAIYVSGSGTGLALQHVTARSEGYVYYNAALNVASGANVGAFDSRFDASGGAYANGIMCSGIGTTLSAQRVTTHAQGASLGNRGLANLATAVLHGGRYTAHGGAVASGIYSSDGASVLEASGVTAAAEDASSVNQGLYNYGTAALHGGSYTARGGDEARGIYNQSGSRELEALAVAASAQGAEENHGLYNHSGVVTLWGGSFSASGGVYAFALYNESATARLFVQDATALASGGTFNTALYNTGSALALLVGGSYVATGGSQSYGLMNVGNSNAQLDARRVTASGSGASVTNYGLYTTGASAVTNVTQSTLDGSNHAVIRASGTVTVSNSRLVGGAVSSAVTCVLTSRGTTVQSSGTTCP